MLFNSYEFLFAFLPVVLMGWWSIRAPPARLAFLAASSYFFYAWWDWRFLPLMLASTTVDYVAGRALVALDDDEPRRRAVLVAALTANLAMLGYFKYAGFFLDSLNGIGSTLGLGRRLPVLRVVLPIGISFYTFNSMSYTIDVFRRRVRPPGHTCTTPRSSRCSRTSSPGRSCATPTSRRSCAGWSRG